MSNMTDLLVKDDAATPIEITLIPVTDTPDSVWRAGLAGVPLFGQPRLTVSVGTTKSGLKITAKLEVPVMETLGASGTSSGYVAPPKVAYVDTIITTMFADGRSTKQDRANLLKLHLGIIQGASATTATGVLANTAAGSAFVESVLPIVETFVSAIRPQ
jgi:hypothetical protein